MCVLRPSKYGSLHTQVSSFGTTFFVLRVERKPNPRKLYSPHWNSLRVVGHCPTRQSVFVFTSGRHVGVFQLLQEGSAVRLKRRLELDPNKHVTAATVAMETVWLHYRCTSQLGKHAL
jgi:hypothetical protein